MTPGLNGKQFIHYTTEAPVRHVGLVVFATHFPIVSSSTPRVCNSEN